MDHNYSHSDITIPVSVTGLLVRIEFDENGCRIFPENQRTADDVQVYVLTNHRPSPKKSCLNIRKNFPCAAYVQNS